MDYDFWRRQINMHPRPAASPLLPVTHGQHNQRPSSGCVTRHLKKHVDWKNGQLLDMHDPKKRDIRNCREIADAENGKDDLFRFLHQQFHDNF